MNPNRLLSNLASSAQIAAKKGIASAKKGVGEITKYIGNNSKNADSDIETPPEIPNPEEQTTQSIEQEEGKNLRTARARVTAIAALFSNQNDGTNNISSIAKSYIRRQIFRAVITSPYFWPALLIAFISLTSCFMLFSFLSNFSSLEEVESFVSENCNDQLTQECAQQARCNMPDEVLQERFGENYQPDCEGFTEEES